MLLNVNYLIFLMAKELERKWIIDELPDNLGQYAFKKIDQGYLELLRFKDTELRVRKKGNKYFLTVKEGESIKDRKEYETEITFEAYEILWPLTDSVRIHKIRYKIPDGVNTIELDIYKENLEGLVTVEVEFNTHEELMDYSPPQWFGREVSDEDGYKNRNLAVYGIPE